MNYKKLFFPIGIGEELKERIHSALMISKFFQAHLDILKGESTPKDFVKIGLGMKELNKIVENRDKEDEQRIERFIVQEAKNLGVILSDTIIENTPTTRIITSKGSMEKVLEQESKYCDVILVASPPYGKITEAFETSITKSGKPAIVFPRLMKNFSANNIIIGWNNSTVASRAVSLAIPLLQNAKKVHIVTSKEYTKDEIYIKKLQEYLKSHNIKSTYDIVETTMIPGEALLNEAQKGEFDMIVAGAFGHRGFRELMFGGTTEYILENTKIPIFISH